VSGLVTSQKKEALHLRQLQRRRDGERPEELSRMLEINLRTIYRWLERFHNGGKKRRCATS